MKTKKENKYNFRFGYQLDLSHELPIIKNLKDRFEHTYIVGKTGMGKSSLMEQMAEYDINNGLSVIFIDPKGESVKKLKELTKDKSKTKYFSLEHPIVINPLHKEGYSLDNLIQEFIQILDVLITLTSSNPESTVLMREIISMAMRSIHKEEDKNINYLTKLLLYPEKRKELITTLRPKSDEWLYWKDFDERDGRQSRNKLKIECAQRVASRLIEISTGEMKDFVSGENELDISEIVNNKKVILLDTSRMNRNSRIYLTNLIVYAILSYCEFSKNKNLPLIVYIDEFQIVVSELFSDLLARSRGSNVGFILAHQNFQQIPKNILGSIFGNVGTSVCFRCGDEEARRFAPIFNIKANELFNLPKYNAWLRIGTDNILIETYPPKATLPTESNNPSIPHIQQEIIFSEKELNFLGDEWINL